MDLVDGIWLLTLGDRPGGSLHAFRMDDRSRAAYSSIDPTRDVQQLTSTERSELGALERAGAVAVVEEEQATEILGLVPVLRKSLGLTAPEQPPFEYRLVDLDAAERPTAELSDIAARFVPLLDGRTPLGVLCEEVARQVVEDPEDRQALAHAEIETGLSVRDLVVVAALEVAIALSTLGAANFERSAD